MATVALSCAAIASQDGWTLGAGATKVIAVAAPDDADTTYIRSTTAGAKQYFTLSALPGGIGSISQVAGTARAKESGGELGIDYRMNLLLGGTTVNGTTTEVTQDVYADTTEVLARPGGGAWQIADFTTLEFGVEQVNDNVTLVHVTTLYLTVTYEPAAGNFAFLVASYLAPVLAPMAAMFRRILTPVKEMLLGNLAFR